MFDRNYRKMKPEERELFVERTIKSILDKSKFGISIADIEKIPDYNFNRKTISKYLEKLEALNEAYSKKVGNVVLYYPNHKSPHFSIEKEQRIGNKKYRIVLIENPLGEFIQLQEIEEDKLYGDKTSGGILIQKKDFDKFIDFIKGSGVLENGR